MVMPFTRRHPMRLDGYDYSLEGAYFITIATFRHVRLFGDIIDGHIELNKLGRIALEQWKQLSSRFYPSEFTIYVIMPNHIHGVVLINTGARDEFHPEFDQIPPLRHYNNTNPTRITLGRIIRAYKASVTFRINAIRGSKGRPIWQPNYYDHIIRNEQEYADIAGYIEANPTKWTSDALNP
jgi:REP element-mobilizing transposase RayT